jgi:predicted translation initiation factor SUI1
MPGLEDLASMLGIPERKAEQASSAPKRVGHDGQVLRLRVRTEKRRGKTISIAWGFSSHPKELDRLLTLFKKSLGAGGQIVDQTIEMQGDHVQRIKDLLIKEGYRVG